MKNNLQVISSLLNLQAGNVQDEQIREAFRDCQNRIRTMALVHEKLYGSDDLARIDLTEYTRSLTSHLIKSYGIERRVKLTLNLEEISLGIDKAIPFGLILNELLINCIKHAFPEGRMGEIYIELQSIDGKSKLTVRDNGVGLPKDLDIQNVKSLGLMLVHNLVKQLKGTIESQSKDGSKFKIMFTA